jgi:hypothetical protein
MEKTVISPKKHKQTMTDTKRIILLCNAVETAKDRLLELYKYEASTETIKYLNDILKLIY